MDDRARPATIVFVNGSGHIEGDTRVLIDTVATLDRDRYRAVVVTAPGAAAEELRALPGVAVREAPLGPARAFLPGRLGQALAFVLGTFAVVRAVIATRARIVYTYDRTRAAESAFFAAKLMRRRLVFHAHYAFNLEHRRMRRFVAFRADRIVIISEFVAGYYRRAGAPESRIRVVLNGADAARYAAVAEADLRASLAIPPSAPVVGLVGRLSPFKGQEELLRAAAILRKQYPDLHILMRGRDTDESRWTHGADAVSYRAILERVRSELRLDDCVHILDHGPAADVYAASDIVAVPSHDEQFGLVVIEAMLAGKPVVATRAGGIPEIITDGETGVLVAPKDPAALAEGIARLLADRDLRERIADAGQRHAREAFSRERYARDFAAAIEGL